MAREEGRKGGRLEAVIGVQEGMVWVRVGKTLWTPVCIGWGEVELRGGSWALTWGPLGCEVCEALLGEVPAGAAAGVCEWRPLEVICVALFHCPD